MNLNNINANDIDFSNYEVKIKSLLNNKYQVISNQFNNIPIDIEYDFYKNYLIKPTFNHFYFDNNNDIVFINEKFKQSNQFHYHQFYDFIDYRVTIAELNNEYIIDSEQFPNQFVNTFITFKKQFIDYLSPNGKFIQENFTFINDSNHWVNKKQLDQLLKYNTPTYKFNKVNINDIDIINHNVMIQINSKLNNILKIFSSQFHYNIPINKDHTPNNFLEDNFIFSHHENDIEFWYNKKLTNYIINNKQSNIDDKFYQCFKNIDNLSQKYIQKWG